MEFICLNLYSVLENRYLDHIDESLLEHITNYYCKFNTIMSSRVITPFYNAPNDDTINEFSNNYPIDLNITDDDIKRDDAVLDSAKKKNKQSRKIEYTESEKERMRYESVSSVTSLDLSNETGDITLSLRTISKDEKGARDKQEKWIEVPSAQHKQAKLVQARLKAITNAKEILNETPVESFTKLSRSSSFGTVNAEATSSRMSVSPKESPIAEAAWSSPSGNFIVSHIGPKLSQKQRKKLAMQGNEQTTSLVDYVSNKLNISSPPEKPKNPWKICEVPTTSDNPRISKTVEFNKILTDQRKQKEDFSRIMTKPLLLTQVLQQKLIICCHSFFVFLNTRS